MLVRPVARVYGEVLDRLALLQQPLAASEVSDERRELPVPRDVAVDVRAGEVLCAGYAELRRRAGERVPDKMVDPADETLVAAELDVARVDRPVQHHVRERLGRGARQAVEVCRGGGGTYVVAAFAVAARPELALREVIDREVVDLVGLAEYLRLALPRSAGLRHPADVARVRKVAHGAVEVVEEHVVARTAVGAHELLLRGDVAVGKARQLRKVGVDVEPRVLLELVPEVAGPGGHCAFPAHGVEVRERAVPADQVRDAGHERSLEAVEVSLDGLRVQHVDVMLVPRKDGVAEAHGHALRARRSCLGQHACRGGVRSVQPFSARCAHRVYSVAAVLPFGWRRQLVAGVPHRLERDVVVVGEVGLLQRRLFGAGWVELVHEALGRVRAHVPRTVQLAAGGAHVHGELESEPRGLADGVDNEFLPF